MALGRSLAHIRRPGVLSFLTLFLFLCSQPLASQQYQKETPLHRQFGFSRTKAGETKAGSGKSVKGGAPTREGKENPPKPVSGKKAEQGAQSTTENPAHNEASAEPLILGYSIIQGERAGAGERILLTRAAKVFRIGDRIRLLIETNADGYLYVFNTVDGKDPEMIFPSQRLNDGDNRIVAHVPYEIPSRENPDPKLQWFEFQPPPGAEQLYLVFSREQLERIPSGQALLFQCQRRSNCLVRPEPAVWDQIATAEKLPKLKETLKSEAQPLAENVNKSVARRIRLPREAPKPTVLSQNQSAADSRIVVVVNIESRR